MASSPRQKTRSDDRNHKQIGCMSGIFQLFHKHNRGRKRIAQAGTTGPNASSPARPKETIVNLSPEKESSGEEKHGRVETLPENFPGIEFRRLSCDAPRSPTLPSEMRLSVSLSPRMEFSPEKISQSPGPVARLMGLEENPTKLPESSEERRRNILGALEKCDEDLQALKKIIDAIQMAESRRKTAVGSPKSVVPAAVKAVKTQVKLQTSMGREDSFPANLNGRSSKRSTEINSEQPSPVSVLDAWSYRDEISPIKLRSDRVQKGSNYKKSKEELNNSFFNIRMVRELARFYCQKNDLVRNSDPLKNLSSKVQFSSSEAMVETVKDVWKEGYCEERRGLGIIGVVLEGDIFGELVEEMVLELGNCDDSPSLKFHACRKRLCF